MAKSCPSCKVLLSTSDLTIKCSVCDLSYHVSCTKIRTESKLKNMGDARDTWKCDDCRNDLAPNASKTELSTKNEAGKDPILEAIKELSVKIDQNFLKTCALETKMEQNHVTLTKLQESFDSLKRDNSALKTEMDELRNNNDNLYGEIHDLKLEVCDLQQYSRRDNIEIVGIPVTGGEDVYSIVAAVARAVKVPYNRDLISVAHRVPKSKEGKGHPTIVVKFLSRTTRDTWMTASRDKERGKLKTTDVSPSLRQGDVFINEHLTVHNKMILYRAKLLVKGGKLKYAWVRDGKVLVKKEADSKAVRIWHLEGLTQV